MVSNEILLYPSEDQEHPSPNDTLARVFELYAPWHKINNF
jgi:hypothetical protein